jgi:hypothetical protein
MKHIAGFENGKFLTKRGKNPERGGIFFSFLDYFDSKKLPLG